jgi:chitinase
MFRRRARLTAGIAAALVVASLSLAPGSASAAGGLTATFTKSSDWGTGYEATYPISNGGTVATSSWTLEFDLPDGARITSLWEGTFTQTGNHVTVHNAAWNGSIAPGGSVVPGYDAAYTGTFVAPTNCLINGGSCAGGGSPPPPADTTAPTVPAGLRSTGTTSSSVALAWTASSDNVGVTGYDVFRDGTLATTVTGTSATVAGLTASTAYSFAVAAGDAAGNSSARSAAVSVTTAAGGTPPPPPPPPGGPRKVGYFAQWSIYGRNFTLHTLDAQAMAGKLSTINYAFENVGSDGKCFEANLAGQGDAFADYQKTFDAATSVSGVADRFDQPLKGNFNQLRELKAKYPNLSVQVSIGGWTYSKFFSDAALTAASRQALVSSCIDMFIKGNLPFVQGDPSGGPGSAAGVFDGIDIDWEWPGSEGNTGNVIRPQDKQNFTLLMAEFRRQLDAYGATVGRHYSLSAFLPADPAKIAAGFEVPQIFGSLDWATVQGYDFHGAWEGTTMHQANLFPVANDPSPVKFSGDLAISSYTSAGVPASELLLGLPYYGRGWTGVGPADNGLFQAGTAAQGTWEAGIEDYKVLKNRAGTRFRDTAAGALWLYDGTNWWSYDDPTVVAQKTAYVKQKGLGGVMVWELDGDDGTLTTAVDTGLR